MKRASILLALFAVSALQPGVAQDAKSIYDTSCAGCHNSGIAGSPKFGDAAQWAPRIKGGLEALVKSALAGTAKGMPPKGGRADLSEAQVRSVVAYIVKAAGGPGPVGAAAAPATAKGCGCDGHWDAKKDHQEPLLKQG